MQCNRRGNAKLTIAEFARGLQRVGLDVEPLQLRKLLRPYMHEDPSKSEYTPKLASVRRQSVRFPLLAT